MIFILHSSVLSTYASQPHSSSESEFQTTCEFTALSFAFYRSQMHGTKEIQHNPHSSRLPRVQMFSGHVRLFPTATPHHQMPASQGGGRVWCPNRSGGRGAWPAPPRRDGTAPRRQKSSKLSSDLCVCDNVKTIRCKMII